MIARPSILLAGPKGRPAASAYLREFIEEAKAEGFVAGALAESGVADATVAPAAR